LHNEGHNLWSLLNIRIEGTLAENLEDTTSETSHEQAEQHSFCL